MKEALQREVENMVNDINNAPPLDKDIIIYRGGIVPSNSIFGFSMCFLSPLGVLNIREGMHCISKIIVPKGTHCLITEIDDEDYSGLDRFVLFLNPYAKTQDILPFTISKSLYIEYDYDKYKWVNGKKIIDKRYNMRNIYTNLRKVV